MDRVIISVRGGSVCAVYTDNPELNVTVLDYDVMDEAETSIEAIERFEAIEAETDDLISVPF